MYQYTPDREHVLLFALVLGTPNIEKTQKKLLQGLCHIDAKKNLPSTYNKATIKKKTNKIHCRFNKTNLKRTKGMRTVLL